ncbi:MAG: response regulator [Archangium sp.]
MTELPCAELRFQSAAALRHLWARHVADGAIFLAGGRTASKVIRVDVFVGDRHFPDNRARPVNAPPNAGPQPIGMWVEITPGPALTEFFTEQRASNTQSPMREHSMRLDLSNREALLDAWETGLSSGHCFINTLSPPPLKSVVTLIIDLPGATSLQVDAMVLHRVLSGPRAGVGLEVTADYRLTLSSLEALLNQTPAPRRPRVLCVDDENVWRSTYARLLQPHGVDLLLAHDGQQGLELLIDHFFELDLVVLDLHMPHLDGRALIDRIRRLGGETGLHLFLISAAGEDELRSLSGPQGATRVLSKLTPIDQLEQELLSALKAAEPAREAA